MLLVDMAGGLLPIRRPANQPPSPLLLLPLKAGQLDDAQGNRSLLGSLSSGYYRLAMVADDDSGRSLPAAAAAAVLPAAVEPPPPDQPSDGSRSYYNQQFLVGIHLETHEVSKIRQKPEVTSALTS